MAKLFFVSVTIILPIIFFVYAIMRRHAGVFILGALAFIISQLLIRIPLIHYLANNNSTYQIWSVTNPIVIILFLAFTAGLVEELARWIFIRARLKDQTVRNGIIFGLGHGGIEALLLIGVPVVSSTIYMMQSQLLVLSSIERLCAMTIHICLSLLVLIGVRKRAFRFCMYAIIIHTLINFAGGYFAKVQSPIVVEVVLIVLTCLLVGLTIQILRRNGENEKMATNSM